MPLYFAYGANVNPDLVKERFADTLGPPLFVGALQNHRLTFSSYSEREGGGVADMEPVDGETVWGLVFELSSSVLDQLDEAEGAKLNPPQYRRVTKKVRIDRTISSELQPGKGKGAPGAIVDVVTYEAAQKQVASLRPNDRYLANIVKGVLHWGIPLSYLRQVLAAIPGRLLVDDIQLGRTDLSQSRIIKIYSKVPPSYAVYQTEDRVSVQYGDDPNVASQQRSAMATLNAARTQISALINGWAKSTREEYQAKARKYQTQVAAALILCLEGDKETARAALDDIKADIISERTSWGRFEYLISASLLAAATVFACALVQTLSSPPNSDTTRLWLAAGAGSVGAFFSIALGIQDRTVLTNLHRRDNVADATLRITIGIISASVLVLLLASSIIQNFSIGGAKVSGEEMKWEVVLIVGFVAGFLERLVPDLLKRSAVREEAPAVKPAALQPAKPGPAPPPRGAPPAVVPPAPAAP